MTALADFTLPGWMRHTLRKLFAVVCPADAPVERLLDETELFLRSLAVEARVMIVVGSATFELLPLLQRGTFGRRFSQLPPAAAGAYFERWWNSSLAPLFGYARGVKSMLTMAYYELPEVKARLEYRPDPWIEQVSRSREQRYGAEIRAHQQRLLARDPMAGSRR